MGAITSPSITAKDSLVGESVTQPADTPTRFIIGELSFSGLEMTETEEKWAGKTENFSVSFVGFHFFLSSRTFKAWSTGTEYHRTEQS